MPDATIAVINGSTVMQDSEVEALVPALQRQIREDFKPAWHRGAKLEFIATGQQPPSGAWWLAVLDNSDQAGALGYHDVTNEGLPLSKVFAGTDLQYGAKVPVTMSHELLEMLGDPGIDQCVFLQENNTTGIIIAYENCDAVEADDLGYEIDGVTVSDFVTPAWFMPGFPGPFDHLGHCDQPLQLLPGGYISVYDVTKGTGWQQVTAEKQAGVLEMSETLGISAARAVTRPHVGSRRERRRTPRNQWQRSEVRF